jgi:hypothetical protein
MAFGFYNKLFRELFPEEWDEFARKLARDKGLTLMQIFADSPAEMANVTNESPSLELFTSLMEARYFPIPDIWLEAADISSDEDGESELEYFFREIPLRPFYENWEISKDIHILPASFGVIKILSGDKDVHKTACGCGEDCELRALVSLACNELYRIEMPRLRKLCRRERGPLRHLSLAVYVTEKCTGNPWFDFDYEMYGSTNIPWTAKNVRWLGGQYAKAEESMAGLRELNLWFAKDLRRIRDASALWRRAATL